MLIVMSIVITVTNGKRKAQIDYVCAKLKTNPNTRHAAISIYDGKEYDKIQERHALYLRGSVHNYKR